MTLNNQLSYEIIKYRHSHTAKVKEITILFGWGYWLLFLDQLIPRGNNGLCSSNLPRSPKNTYIDIADDNTFIDHREIMLKKNERGFPAPALSVLLNWLDLSSYQLMVENYMLCNGDRSSYFDVMPLTMALYDIILNNVGQDTLVWCRLLGWYAQTLMWCALIERLSTLLSFHAAK
jgi:hypothetical protein